MMPRSEDIVCFEAGSGEPPWMGTLAGLHQDLNALRRLANDGVIRLELEGRAARVFGTDHVGLVVLPSGRRLIIRSKIFSLVLLDWLSYLGEFPPLDSWLPDAGVTTGDDLHTCIARLFLYELEKVTRRHLRKDYTPVVAETVTIRGHILTTKLSRRLGRLPHVPQRIRSRTLNTGYNIVLAMALDRLPMLLANASPDDRKLLNQLRDAWAQVSREFADPIRAATEAQWAAPLGYQGALQLGRLVLTGVALDPKASMGGQAFTMSLALVWERCVRRMFDDLSRTTGWVCLSDAKRTRQWDDSAGRDDPNRWLSADVLVARDDIRWVLDAKYKRAFGSESRVDRFQMCAYAVGFDADRVSLVYPTAFSTAQERTLLDTTVGAKRLVIDSIDLPMRDGPERCRNELVQLCLSC